MRMIQAIAFVTCALVLQSSLWAQELRPPNHPEHLAPISEPCMLDLPCAVGTFQERIYCAERRAEWVVEGIATFQGNLLTIDKATVIRGEIALLPDNNGHFYLWKSCWGKCANGGKTRVYGLKNGGAFFSSTEAPVAYAANCNMSR